MQRDQFETPYHHVQDAPDGFDLARIPPETELYAAVFTLSCGEPSDEGEQTEPDLSVYPDALPLIDALECHDLCPLDALETNAVVNLHKLLSDVQRGANDLRQKVAEVLLDRLHHDRPVHSHAAQSSRPLAATASSRTTTKSSTCWKIRGSMPTASCASNRTRWTTP